ncbi:MAG: hypothetical protein FWH22_11580 [Fibromonadales bacterium]|nr:hypothetical protein [Fibromonadales bacterium]
MLRFILLLALFILASCASNKAVTRDPERVNEVMITFVQKAQAGFWKEAMESVTPIERDEMMEDGLVVFPEYRDAVGRIRLTNTRNMNLGLDRKNRLVGLKAALEESNALSRVPDAQANLDLTSFEKNRSLQKEEENREMPEKPKEEDGFSSFIESFIKETVVDEETAEAKEDGEDYEELN